MAATLDEAVKCLELTLTASEKQKVAALTPETFVSFDRVFGPKETGVLEITDQLMERFAARRVHFEDVANFVVETYWLDLHGCDRDLEARYASHKAFSEAMRRGEQAPPIQHLRCKPKRPEANR